MKTLTARWLGRVAYGPAFELQRATADQRASGETGDTLLLLEHDPVYTLGRRATEAEVLLDAHALRERGIAVEHSDRGGRVTYHGPGQLVGYPIVDLGTTNDLVGYVRALERALVAVCARHGVNAGTIEGLTGVWVGNDKVAAIGVHVARLRDQRRHRSVGVQRNHPVRHRRPRRDVAERADRRRFETRRCRERSRRGACARTRTLAAL